MTTAIIGVGNLGGTNAGRSEGPDGDLQGRALALDEALATTATEGVKA